MIASSDILKALTNVKEDSLVFNEENFGRVERKKRGLLS